jgi:hypothetical protein
MREARNAVDKIADELTAETGLTASELDVVFVQVSTAMTRYEAYRASVVDLNEDPRLVGLFLQAGVGHADAAVNRSGGQVLFDVDNIDRARIAAVKLLASGAEAVTNQEVQAVYNSLPDNSVN